MKSKGDRKRVYVGAEIDELQDKSSLFFSLPFERGYLVNWNVELEVWDRVFGKNGFNVDFSDCRLVQTDPSSLVPAIKDISDEVAFEVYQFHSYAQSSAPTCVAQANLAEDGLKGRCSLVVDSGYSFTHIVPYIDGKICSQGVIRIDVGGKALTNQLKEWVSYRQVNVLEETYVINQCKEDVCYVSLNFDADMLASRLPPTSNPIRREYVLPDFLTLHRGEVRQPDKQYPSTMQSVQLDIERFATPEILFQPSNVHVDQMGIVEAIIHSLANVAEETYYDMLQNIILIGGNAHFPGYLERIRQDLRPDINERYNFEVTRPNNPSTYAWHCAEQLVREKKIERRFVTKAEYAEHGQNICLHRFDDYWHDE
ncbi:Actin family protein [Aphelenchoides avenae]|nr:Actin family protein [Aphelenchus avenae]